MWSGRYIYESYSQKKVLRQVWFTLCINYLCSVYVDGKWYGEVKSNKLGNKHGYQFILNDLNPEQSYDISVKAIAGYKRVDKTAQHIFCLSEGQMSNVINVMAPAAPKSPKLRLEGLTPDGIDVTWQIPQQHGDAAISVRKTLKTFPLSMICERLYL